MPPLGYRRATPLSSPAIAGGAPAPVVPDARAARERLRALAVLVDRMAVVGGGRAIMNADPKTQAAVREAIRDFASRIRDDPMQCRIMNGQFVLAGAPVDRSHTQNDPLLTALLQRCVALGIGGISIRQGAAPGELLMLATVLIRPPQGPEQGPVSRDTPTSMRAITAEAPPQELMRSWSVLVTPVEGPVQQRAPSVADGLAQLNSLAADWPPAAPVATAVQTLAVARSEGEAAQAADAVIRQIEAAESRADGRLLEALARAMVTLLHAVGTGGGRLAMERVLRHLQRRRVLELLAMRLPSTTDRLPLLEILARAGEVSAEELVKLLMEADDPPSRRAYFDSIVSLDVGGALLFEMLRDSRWFVVRNAIALLGEMGVETADAVMVPLLRNKDDRIRVAAARGLLRLSTPRALQGLQAVIEDRHPEVRRLSATSYGLTTTTGVRTLAARLAAAFEREQEEDVALEMLAALGRLGSADAIQRLIRIALPPQAVEEGSRVAPRPAYLRIAALEALVRARGAATESTIELLAQDPDPQVAAAAARMR